MVQPVASSRGADGVTTHRETFTTKNTKGTNDKPCTGSLPIRSNLFDNGDLSHDSKIHLSVLFVIFVIFVLFVVNVFSHRG